MYKRKASDKQIDNVIYKAEHNGFGLNKEELDAYMAEYFFGNVANPIGTIIAFMGNIPPVGYLICDGSEYNIVDYPKLAQFFKDQFGSTQYFGGTNNKFKVPDLRGEFLRGTGTNSHANQGSGGNVGEHQGGTEHIFTVTDGVNGNNKAYYVGLNTSSGTAGTMPQNMDTSIGTSHTNIYSASTRISNNTWARYTSRPTNTSVLYCIKSDIVTK